MDLNLPVVTSLLFSEPFRDPPDTLLMKPKDLRGFLEVALESPSLPRVLRSIDQLPRRGKGLLLTLSSVLLRRELWKVRIRFFLVPSSIVCCKSSVAFDSISMAMFLLDPFCFMRSLCIFFSATTWFCKMRRM